jgi:hypothetical protein
VPQLFSSEASTHLNSDGEKKLRKTDWLISAMLREINQLRRRIAEVRSRALVTDSSHSAAR